VHQERPVRDVLDLDAGKGADRGHDPVEVIGVLGEHRDVADLGALLHPYEVDRVERAADVADRLREVRTAGVTSRRPGWWR
jgi:hypothetical protein